MSAAASGEQGNAADSTGQPTADAAFVTNAAHRRRQLSVSLRGVDGAASRPEPPHGADAARPDNDNDDTSSQASGLQQEQDPFYDETADDADATWADQQRSGRVSDAVLSCPGCFTTLCIDCQRHEKYHSQYRAMFVMNCQVDEEDEEGSGAGAGAGFDPGSASAGAGTGGRGGRRPKRSKTSAQYRRVRCGVCGAEVGALEVEEELYHFYHVFPSNA